MPVYDTFREWALASQANRVYAVTLTPVRRLNYSVSRSIYLCTEPMLGHADTVFDEVREYVPCVTAIPDIHHSAQVIFSGSNLVSFGAVKITMNPAVSIDPGTEWEAWEDDITYELGRIVRPTTPSGLYHECIAPGASGATEPDWPFVVGRTVGDGGCTWQCKQLTWDVLLDEWVFAGHQVVIKLGGPELAWEDWATVLTGYMGEPSYSDTECTIPVFSPAVKALQAEIPPRSYDPDQWEDVWVAEAPHEIGDMIVATTSGFEKIAVTPSTDGDGWFTWGEVISSGYFFWKKWWPVHAFDGDTTIYQIQHGDAESQHNRWLTHIRAGGPSGVDYIGIKKASPVRVDRVRIFQMAETWMPRVKLQFRDSDGESWATLATIAFTVGGNAWETRDVADSEAHNQWRLLADAAPRGTHLGVPARNWGIYELELLTAGETRGYLYLCVGAYNSKLSGTSEPDDWPTTPGEQITEKNGGVNTLAWRCLRIPDEGESKPLPLCYGVVKNLSPVMVDSDAGSEIGTGRIFQFHDHAYGAPQGVDAVYVNGVLKTEDDDYLVYPGKGIVRFRSSCDMDGPVTMDVHGAELSGTYSDLPGDIIRQWLSDFAGMAEASLAAAYADYQIGETIYRPAVAGDTEYPVTSHYYRVVVPGTLITDTGRPWEQMEGAIIEDLLSPLTLVCHRRMGGVDLEALTALNQDLPFPVGVYIAQRVTVKQALDELLSGLMAWWGVTREGDFTAARFRAPSPSSALIPWNASTFYQAGQIIRPRLSAFYYQCLVGGQSGYSEPAWPEEDEAELVENTANPVTWQAVAIEADDSLVFTEADILEFEVVPEERLTNKCTVYGDRNWTPGQSLDETGPSVERRQWLRQQWRERVASADEDLIRIYPLAATMSHQTFLANLEDCANLAEGYVQLFGVKREKVRITVAAHGLLASIGDQVLVVWGRYGYADGLYARVVAIRESHGLKPRVVLEAWR